MLRLCLNADVHVTLAGDACGLGETRKRELVKACRVLGVEEVSAMFETVELHTAVVVPL